MASTRHHYYRRFDRDVASSEPQNETTSNIAPTLTDAVTEIDTTLPPSDEISVTHSNIEQKLIKEIAEKTHLPIWAVIAIIILICTICFCFCCCYLRRWCKRKKKDSKKGFKGTVDLRNVQILDGSYKKKVAKAISSD